MTRALTVGRTGPAVTVQDLGRPGYLAFGLSQGGAADVMAMAEGAALLGQSADLAAIEMAGFGADFTASEDMFIALTGAPMQAKISGQPVLWNASHMLPAGKTLSIGAATTGIYGYLHVGGGIATQAILGSRSTHLTGGIGKPVATGEVLPIGTETQKPRTSLRLPAPARFAGGTLRVLAGVHTDLFTPETRTRFETTTFHRTLKGNRQAAELTFEGAPFTTTSHLSVLSEAMVPGDIQMTGEGIPFVSLPECQTTGGYPRIATILPDDLPLVAQASPNAPLRFKFITHEEALSTHRPVAKLVAATKAQLQPLVRDPAEMADLLGYQLISGAVSGEEP